MKKLILILAFIFSTSILYAQSWEPWKFFFAHRFSEANGGVDICRYAKAIGYTGVAITGTTINNYQWANNQNIQGLKFWLIDPMYYELVLGNSRDAQINTSSPPTGADQTFYNQTMAWVYPDSGTTTFPLNLATGWWTSGTVFGSRWNLQNQSNISDLETRIVNFVTSLQDEAHSFTFAGYMLDVPQLSGDFNSWNGSDNDGRTLSYWTGSDSGIAHGTVTLTYGSYTTGCYQFYKQLDASMTASFGDCKAVFHPWLIKDDWIDSISPVDNTFVTDMIFEEKADTTFVTNYNTYSVLMTPTIAKDMVGNSSPRKLGGGATSEDGDRNIACNAAVNGMWFNFMKRISDGTDSLTEVPDRRLFMRALVGHTNLCKIPLANRGTPTVSGTITFHAETGTISAHIGTNSSWFYDYRNVGSSTRVLWLCLRESATATATGSVTIHSGERLVRANEVNDFWEDAGTVTASFSLASNILSPLSITVADGGTIYKILLANWSGQQRTGGGNITHSGGGSSSYQ